MTPETKNMGATPRIERLVEDVVVKEMEWTGPHMSMWVSEPLPGFQYRIIYDGRGNEPYSWFVGGVWTPAPSLDAAKATAQADYEARIRSAIAPAAQPVPVAVKGLTDAEIKKLWRQNGGSQHGPHVETYTIPEAGFFGFVVDMENRIREIEQALAPAAPMKLRIDKEWLKRKILEDGEEGDIGAGFELFPLPDATSQPQTFKPCAKHPDRYCNCEGFYPACREAPASAAAPPAIEAEAVPVGYLFELCYSHDHNRWSGTMFGEHLPNPSDIRNVRPLFASPPKTDNGVVEALPVAWQWRALDTWHTIDKSSAADPEAYAKAHAGGGQYRPVYATPAQPVPVAVTDAMVHAYKHSFGEYMDKSALGHITPPTPDVGFHATKYALGVALAPAQAVPGDMVLVPRECTLDMEQAFFDENAKATEIFADVKDIWRAMISAAGQVSPASGRAAPEATSTPPCNFADPSYNDCQNMKEVGGGFDGERYRCAVCGKGYFLDYEDMK